MRKIVARFELTTPSFLGGMETTLSGLRGPSLRGVLRFWWRALMFSRFAQDLMTLQNKESVLFGSSGGGTGRVQFLPVQPLTDPHPLSWEEVTNHRDGLTYLGYGVSQRQAFSAPLAFDLPLIIRAEREDSVKEALILMGMLGGIGARSRRGWGSLSLQRIEEDGQVTWTAPTVASLETVWSGLAGHEAEDIVHAKLPPFTVLSPLTRVYLLETGGNALSLLNHVGEELQRYRSFGRHGKVAGRPAEQNFRADHDLMQGATQQIVPTHAPERTIFGLPHNYWFSSTKEKASVTSATQRRASPLFLHVQKLADTYAVVAGLLPAVFVPDTSLTITTTRTKSYPVPADVASYYPRIEQFVTGTHPQDHSRRFPQEVSLWP